MDQFATFRRRVYYLGCILLVHFLPLLFFADFADIENVFFWVSLGKTADFEAQMLEGFSGFAEISDFVSKRPVGLL